VYAWRSNHHLLSRTREDPFLLWLERAEAKAEKERYRKREASWRVRRRRVGRTVWEWKTSFVRQRGKRERESRSGGGKEGEEKRRESLFIQGLK